MASLSPEALIAIVSVPFFSNILLYAKLYWDKQGALMVDSYGYEEIKRQLSLCKQWEYQRRLREEWGPYKPETNREEPDPRAVSDALEEIRKSVKEIGEILRKNHGDS